jgi:hypothetical protein
MTQNKTLKDQQTRTSEIIRKFHDAQTAAQHDAFEAVRAGVTGAVAFQRESVDAVTRALDATARAAVPDEKALDENVKTWAATLPALTPETREKLAKDAREGLLSLRSTTDRAVTSLRDTTTRVGTEYARALDAAESRSVDGLKTLEENATRALMLTNRVTDAWADAFFEATRATTHAIDEARSAVVDTAAPRDKSTGNKKD